jgi:hypothetical protein
MDKEFIGIIFPQYKHFFKSTNHLQFDSSLFPHRRQGRLRDNIDGIVQYDLFYAD